MTRNPTDFWQAGRLALIAVLGLVTLAPAARAEAISYSMMLCEDLGVLKDPNNSTAAHNAAWTSQHTLMMERTMPYVEIDNRSSSASITQLSMTIGDTSKNFDWASLIQASPGVTFSLQSPDAIAGGLKSGVLTISFSNFKPGDFVRFRMGLSPNDPNASPIMDYRNVLFHMNGGSDVSGNSVVSVRFNSTDGNSTLSNPLPNFPYTMMTATDLSFHSGYGMDSIGAFGTPVYSQIVQVPEPSSVVLLGAGALSMAALARRRRKLAA